MFLGVVCLVLFAEKPGNAIHSVVINLRNVASFSFNLLPLARHPGGVPNTIIATVAVIYNDIYLRL
jgi:hypothetical protein